MMPRYVVVAHSQAMVAEGLAAGLATHPAIIPIGIATSAVDALEVGKQADAVAIDEKLTGSELAAAGLRRSGVRVVTIGDRGTADEGARVSPQEPVAVLADALVPDARVGSRGTSLTPREEQILELVAEGLSAKQVASRLQISPKTVEQHKTRIFTKLGVPNSTAAVSHALSRGNRRSVAWNLSTI
jgi:DNA-binding CsgD family transcriptional regulator